MVEKMSNVMANKIAKFIENPDGSQEHLEIDLESSCYLVSRLHDTSTNDISERQRNCMRSLYKSMFNMLDEWSQSADSNDVFTFCTELIKNNVSKYKADEYIPHLERLQRNVNAIPLGMPSVLDFWDFILDTNTISPRDRKMYKHPNGWQLRYQLRYSIRKTYTYEDAKSNGIRTQMYIYNDIGIEIKDRDFMNTYHKRDGNTYIDLDDCLISELEPLFKWFATHNLIDLEVD